MIFMPVSDTNHIKMDAKCYKDTKSFLIAWLNNHELKSGCYIYFDKNENPLYVGKTNTLHSRLLHHATSQGIERAIPDWYFLGVIFSNNPHLTEKELIRALQPPFNKLSK